MRKNVIVKHLIGPVLAIMLLPVPAEARTIAYDPPARHVELPSTYMSGDGTGVSCSFYGDVMIRVSGSDTPSPNNALIVPLPASCTRNTPAHGIELRSADSFLDGRKGNFLIFELSDPTGVTKFTIFSVKTGRLLFQDGLYGANGYQGSDGITLLELHKDILHMRYDRGINASCSLLSDRDGCWSQLLKSGQIQRGAFGGPPDLETCKKASQLPPTAPDDTPSIVTYEVALTVDAKRHVIAKPVGPLQCVPWP